MQRLIESLDKMMEARVVWNLLDDKGELEEWESATLLPYVKVSKKTRTVLYEFTNAFQERVYNPSEFAEIALRMQRVFRSEHALALYENTRRFLINGETPWIPLETFRSLMGVNGKPYYDEFKYLSARLIKPAMQQINECSDIQLQLKTKRRNRTVVEIKYSVSTNPQMTLFAESLTQEPTQINTDGERRTLLRLSGYRITGKRAELLLRDYTEEQIILALDAADAWMEIKEAGREPIVNPAGVAYKAITEGWRTHSEEKDIATTGTLTLEDTSPPKLLHSSPERQEAFESEFRKKWYAEFIERTPESKLDLLKSAFEETLVASPSDRIVLEKYRQQGLTGIARGLFQHFLASQGIRPTEEDIKAYTESKRLLRNQA